MKNYILFLFLSLVGIVSCKFDAKTNLQIRQGSMYVEQYYHNEEPNKLDSLFQDSVIHYLQNKKPNLLTVCGENYQCHLFSSLSYKKDKNKLSFLCYNCLKYSDNLVIPTESDGGTHIDSTCYTRAVSILYSTITKDFIILDVTDLETEQNRYALKSFLLKNNINITDETSMFEYLYNGYSEFSPYRQANVCSFPNFFRLKDFAKIALPIMKNEKYRMLFGLTQHDFNYFQNKMKEVASKYQANTENYFCGAITKHERSEGKIILYFFIVDRDKPMNYEVFVYKTAKNELYTWHGYKYI